MSIRQKKVWVMIIVIGVVSWMFAGNVYTEEEIKPKIPSVDKYTIALWHFDEAEGQIVMDSSPNHNDGYLGMKPEPDEGDPIRAKSPLGAGNMLKFNGKGQVVTIPNTKSLNSLGNSFTIECWVNIERFSTRQDLVSKKWDSTPSGYLFLLGHNKNSGLTRLLFEWGSHKERKDKIISASSDEFNMQKHKWYHIAVTCNGKEVRFYVNNGKMGKVKATVEIKPNTLPIFIGAYRDPKKISLCGYIDEVRISSSVRNNFPVLSDASEMKIKKVPAISYQPGENIFSWARQLEKAAKAKDISFQIKTVNWNSSVEEGSIIHSNDPLEIELKGAKTEDYNYRFFVDGKYARTEYIVPINFGFQPLPGPHLLTIAVSPKLRPKEVAFGKQLGLIVVDEKRRIWEIPEETSNKLGQLEGNPDLLADYHKEYQSAAKSYSRYQGILNTLKRGSELFPSEQVAIPKKREELFKIVDSVIKKSKTAGGYLTDLKKVISKDIIYAKKECDNMLDNLEQSLKKNDKIPKIASFPSRLVAPLATGGFTDEKQKKLIQRSLKRKIEFGNCVLRGSLRGRGTWRGIDSEMKFYSQIGWPVIVAGSHGWLPKPSTVEEVIRGGTYLSPEDYRLLRLKYGDYFYGIFSAEFDGAAGRFANIPKAKNRLEAMNNFVNNYRKFLDAIRPEGVISMHDSDFGFDNSYLLLAGVDLIASQLWRGENVEVFMSATRGASRSFDKSWGGILTQARLVPSPKVHAFSPITSPEEDAHLLKYLYFNGAKFFGDERAYSLRYPEYREIWEKFYQFAMTHPEPGELYIPIAVVRGQAAGWQGPRGFDMRAPFGYGRMDSFATEEDRFYAITDYGESASYRDFDFLNIFFPEYGCYALSKIAFTGTPYGQIDIIGAVAPLSGFRKYKMLWFLGLNIMTEDLASKLKEYVKDGGTLIMGIEQIKDINGNINLSLLRELFGCNLASDKFSSAQLSGEEIFYSKVKLKGAQTLLKTDGGNALITLYRYGRGRAYLVTTQWQWMLPQELMEAFIRPLIYQAGVPITLTPANPKMENFVYRNGEDITVVLVNNQGWEIKQPWFRRRYQEESISLKELSNISIPVVLNKQKDTMLFEKTFAKPVNFKKFEQMKWTFRTTGRRPGGKIKAFLVDTNGKKYSFWIGDGYDFQGPDYTTRYYFGYSRYLREDLIPRGVDLTKIKKVGILFSSQSPDLPLSYNFEIKRAELVNSLVTQKKEIKRKVLAWSGKVILDLDALGLKGNYGVYVMGDKFKLDRIPSQQKGYKIAFSASVSEWKEFRIKNSVGGGI